MTHDIFHVKTFTSPRYLPSAFHLMLMYGDGTGTPQGIINSASAIAKWEQQVLDSIKDQKPIKITCSYGPPNLEDFDPDSLLKEKNDESRTVQLSKIWPDPTSDQLPSRRQTARQPFQLPSTYG